VEPPPARAGARDVPVRATAVGLAWVGLFSLVYSVGDAIGAWPKWPLSQLRDLDLVAGQLREAVERAERVVIIVKNGDLHS